MAQQKKDITVEEASKRFLDHLKELGRRDRTLYTYGKDLEQICAYFKSGKLVSRLLPAHASQFLYSEELLMLPDGTRRAKATIEKTVRLLRMFLIWLYEEGYTERFVLPKTISMGRSKLTELQNEIVEKSKKNAKDKAKNED